MRILLSCVNKLYFMYENALKPSENFKKMAQKSVNAILLFALTYILLIVAAIGLTIACAFGGIMLIGAKAMLITLMLGGGLICFGVLILVFLIKFVFKENKIDRSHLTLITKEEQPELFQMIEEIVKEVGTDFPKNVYLSSEVNASVFYDSSFWSMFIPVRKNLLIGVGLMNTISVDEFRAILGHEFGHFSQKSMRVGSYVYNVNQIIYNMLYDNEGYNNFVQHIASVSSYLGIFVMMATKIAEGIQYILRKMYAIVNLNHMALSREMEFHADAVAASVTGSQALITSLLRLHIADHALNNVFNFYNLKIKVNEKTNNIYPQQRFVMNFFAGEQRVTFDNNGLPMILEEHYHKFNRNKLVLKDQWASHPSTKDRIEHLQRLDFPAKNSQPGVAVDLLLNRDEVLSQITKKLFDAISYSETPVIADEHQFEQEFLQERNLNSFDSLFNGYYDYRSPLTSFDENAFEQAKAPVEATAADFFTDSRLNLIYEKDGVVTDLDTLKQLADGTSEIKTFDYDGKRYAIEDCNALIDSLNTELEQQEAQLKELDTQIFNYFIAISAKQNNLAILKSLYENFKEIADRLDSQGNAHNKIANAASFMHTSTPFEVIEQNLIVLKKEEMSFKEELLLLMEKSVYQEFITEEVRGKINAYLSNKYTYFAGKTYFDMQVDELFYAIEHFARIINDTNFNAKKRLLDFQANLEITQLTENKKPVAI